MTREDIYEWIQVHKCEPQISGGINNTVNQVKFYNPQTKTHAYLQTPINDKPIPDYVVCHICTKLGIPIPDCAHHYSPLVTHLKNRFTK